jgi:hypothetical protein
MAKTKAKKEKGHIIMKVYDDYSAIFEIDGDDDWLAAGFAGGLEDERLSKIVVVAAQALLATRQEKQELDIYFEPEAKPVKKAAKKAAPKKKAAKK